MTVQPSLPEMPDTVSDAAPVPGDSQPLLSGSVMGTPDAGVSETTETPTQETPTEGATEPSEAVFAAATAPTTDAAAAPVTEAPSASDAPVPFAAVPDPAAAVTDVADKVAQVHSMVSEIHKFVTDLKPTFDALTADLANGGVMGMLAKMFGMK